MLDIKLLHTERTSDLHHICSALRLHGFDCWETEPLEFTTGATPALLDRVITGAGCTFAEVEGCDDAAYLDEAEFYCT